MPYAYQILTSTPLWVWPLMIFVLALGLWGLKPRILPPARLAILPLVALGTSIAGVAQSLQPGLAAAGWAAALLLALPLGYAIGSRRAVRLRSDGRLELAGGWFALVFGLSIFAVRYALGVVFGIMPALRAEPSWICLSGGVGGFVAGIGLGWLTSLVLRARRDAAVAG